MNWFFKILSAVKSTCSIAQVSVLISNHSFFLHYIKTRAAKHITPHTNGEIVPLGGVSHILLMLFYYWDNVSEQSMNINSQVANLALRIKISLTFIEFFSHGYDSSNSKTESNLRKRVA